jgi:hypothetical protein
VTEIREFTAEVVPFGYPSHNGGSFYPTSLCIVQCEHYFNPIVNLELVSGWNNKSNPGSGDVLHQRPEEAFGCRDCMDGTSNINFSDWAVVTVNIKLSAGVLPKFKKNGKTLPAFTP